MDTFADEAAFLREALRLNLCSTSAVTAWSGDQIGNFAAPPDPLVELSSLSGAHPLDALRLLKELSKDVAPVDTLRRALGAAHYRLVQQPELGPPIANALFWLAVECQYRLPQDLIPIMTFQDDYELIQEGQGTGGEVYVSLLEFTARFKNNVDSRLLSILSAPGT